MASNEEEESLFVVEREETRSESIEIVNNEIEVDEQVHESPTEENETVPDDEDAIMEDVPASKERICSQLSDDEGEDDDPVIQQIPVYVTNELDGKVNIFQFPSRSSTKPLVGNSGVVDARLKPHVGIVEVDIPIETRRFYDEDKKEQWGPVNKQTFGGPLKEVLAINNMVGIFKDGELHLTKVSKISQLRPQFRYFEKEVPKPEPTVQREARTIQMSAKSAGDLAPKFSGALSARKMADDEDNLSLYWYDRDSSETWSVADKLLASKKEKLMSTTGITQYKDELQR